MFQKLKKKFKNKVSQLETMGTPTQNFFWLKTCDQENQRSSLFFSCKQTLEDRNFDGENSATRDDVTSILLVNTLQYQVSLCDELIPIYREKTY